MVMPIHKVQLLLTVINLHAKSCFANSKLCCVRPVKTVDTVCANNSMLSLTTDYCTVPVAHHIISMLSVSGEYFDRNLIPLI